MTFLELIREALYSAYSVGVGSLMTFRNLLGLPVRSYYSMIGEPTPEKWGGQHPRRVTQHYPEEKWTLAARFRGMPTPTVYPDTGEMLCIACLACVRICPTQIIDIQWHKPGPDEPAVNSRGDKLVKIIDSFEIDMGRCLFCALCVELCPTNPKSIVMSRDFEISSASRDGMLFEDQVIAGTHVLPMIPVNSSEDQPATAYVNAAISMGKEKAK